MQLVPWVLCITLIVKFTDIREMSWNFEVFSEKKEYILLKLNKRWRVKTATPLNRNKKKLQSGAKEKMPCESVWNWHSVPTAG